MGACRKIGFEQYFLRKMRKGESEPFYELMALNMLGIEKLKAVKSDEVATQRPSAPRGVSADGVV